MSMISTMDKGRDKLKNSYIFDLEPSEKYKVLSDKQLLGLFYMLPIKLKEDKKVSTLMDCVEVFREYYSRHPKKNYDPDTDAGLGVKFLEEYLKDFKKVDANTVICDKKAESINILPETMLQFAFRESGANLLFGVATHYRFEGHSLPGEQQVGLVTKNFDRISLPLEGMSVSEAADAILSDPKGYAKKEKAEPLRKRQNQFERYINCHGHGDLSTSRGGLIPVGSIRVSKRASQTQG